MQDLKVTIEVTEDDLFTKYVDTEKSASIANNFLREAIIAIVIANTASRTRVDEDYYKTLTDMARMFVNKKHICLFIDDEQADNYVFCGSESQNKKELEKLLGDVVSYQAYFEDSISYNGVSGFCWQRDEQKIALV